VAVPVAVVVADQVVPARLLAAPDLEWLVNGGEEVFGELGGEGAYAGEIGGGVFGVQAAEEVAGRVLVVALNGSLGWGYGAVIQCAVVLRFVRHFVDCL